MTITVRLATLQDVQAICDLHRSHISEWRQLDKPDKPLADYNALTLFERWQHGGPWLSLESCAVHIYRLLLGIGTPLVAELNGVVLAEAEVYESDEAAPFDHSLHLGVLCTHAAHVGRGLGTALLDYAQRMGRALACGRITFSGETLPGFYASSKHHFRLLQTALEANVDTHAGRAVYQKAALTDPDPARINGWYMPLGRYQSARQDWDTLFPMQWAAGIPELLDVPAVQLKLTVAGQNAIVSLRETERAGVCELACWSARPLNATLVTALRDCTHREGFDSFQTLVSEANWPLLQAAEAQLTGGQRMVYDLPIS